MPDPTLPPLNFCTRCGTLAPTTSPCTLNADGHEMVTKPFGTWICIGCGQQPGKMHEVWCATRRRHEWRQWA